MIVRGNIKISVIDKDNNKMVWTERHETLESAHHAVRIMKHYNFNPDFFYLRLRRLKNGPHCNCQASLLL